MSLATIRNKVRYLLGDNSASGSDIFTYDASAVFTLTEDNIASVDTVDRNNAEQDTSGYWTYSSSRNKVTIIGTVASGDTLQINYTYFPNYSNTELNEYIQGALVHLSINNYYDYLYDSTTSAIYPDPLPREENLIALVTALLINPDNKSIRLPDVSISVPDDYPLNKKISMTVAKFKKDTSGSFDIL